jgi:uncharacterized iron-regulated protein
MNNFIVIVSIISFSAFGKITQIYDTQSKRFLRYENFLSGLSSNGYIVLGEIHNTPSIQNSQAKIINDLVKSNGLEKDFTVMWEFLHYMDDQRDNKEYSRLFNGEINASQFIKNTAGERNLTYAPIFDTTSKLKGRIAGLNAYRSVKSQLIKGGLDSIDPKLIPPNMELGGDNYWKRFKKIMGGHVPSAKLERYYLAQCYTDSVMSYMANLKHKTNLSFIIAGSFHTDYFDGTISQLKKLNAEKITTISFRDVNGQTDEDIIELIKPHPEFGPLAHYIILTK